MRHKDVIYLIGATVAADTIGNQIETLTERQIFANEFSISGTDYYNAAATGLRPAKMFEIYSWEYGDETRLRHGDTTYRIIRIETRGEKTRLTCERVAADG